MSFERSTILRPRVPQALANAIKSGHGNVDKWARSATIVCALIEHGMASATICDDEPGMACVALGATSIFQLDELQGKLGFRMRVDGDKDRVVIG